MEKRCETCNPSEKSVNQIMKCPSFEGSIPLACYEALNRGCGKIVTLVDGKKRTSSTGETPGFCGKINTRKI